MIGELVRPQGQFGFTIYDLRFWIYDLRLKPLLRPYVACWHVTQYAVRNAVVRSTQYAVRNAVVRSTQYAIRSTQ